MRGVLVCWIGEAAPPRPLLDGVRAHLAGVLREPVREGFEPERPSEAFDARRGQYESGRILRWLDARQRDADKVLGVTDVDLFIPILTFVFGEAQLDGRAAVVSTARLSPPPALFAGRGLLGERLRKEALHELGHAYGLVHCASPRCVMGRSPGVPEIDGKEAALCADCRLLLDESRRHAR